MPKTKKRKPVKIEHMPPLEMTQAFKDMDFPSFPKSEHNRVCHDCGQFAEYGVWFQGNGYQRIERLCEKCLKDSVIVDEVPIISKS